MIYRLSVLVAVSCGIQIPLSQCSNAQSYSVVIGIDGLAPYGISAGSAPNLESLMDGTWAGPGANYFGTFTNQAYVGGILGTQTQQVTSSGPGWSSILTGVWTDKHGVTNNTFAGSRYDLWPPYLKTLESQLLEVETFGIVTWTPINSNVFVDDGVNPELDFRQGTANDVNTTSSVVSRIGNWPDSSNCAGFVHLDDIDGAGHSSGAYSSGYLAQVADVDSQVGSILGVIRNRPNFSSENWQIVVVADHGHVGGGGHGGQSQMERTIPIIVSSQNVLSGIIPADIRQPSMVDVPATVFNHFGLATPFGQAGVPQGTESLVLNNRTSLLAGLVTHISFDGNTSGPNGIPGGTVSGSVQFTDGRFGEAGLVSNYGTGHVTLDSDLGAAFGLNNDFAMSVWVKYSSFTGDPAFLSNKNWNSGANTGINFALQTVGGGSLDLNTKADTGVRRDIEPFSGIGPSVWHHLLINVDRNGRTLLYVDGYLYGEVTQSSAGSFDGSFQFTLFNDGTGAYSLGSVSDLMIDEFAAWNRLLTLDEIVYLSQSQVIPDLEPISSFVIHNGYTGSGSATDPGKSLAEEGMGGALLTHNNLINSAHGINGIAFEIEELGDPLAISESDFEFQMSPQGAFIELANPPSGWAIAPTPTSVSVTPGSPNHIQINWADNAIENRWLRVTIAANANTGLSNPRTFYLGHLRGETDLLGSTLTVSFADITPIRSQVGITVDAGSDVDIDKNGTVSFADISAMRNNVGAQLTVIAIP